MSVGVAVAGAQQQQVASREHPVDTLEDVAEARAGVAVVAAGAVAEEGREAAGADADEAGSNVHPYSSTSFILFLPLPVSCKPLYLFSQASRANTAVVCIMCTCVSIGALTLS